MNEKELPMIQAKIAIVYHSGYGHTASQAVAVARGAALSSVETMLVAVEDGDAPWDDLAECDALIFGCPTYMGGPSAKFKAFQDATSHAVFGAGFRWRNKIAAGFTNSAARSGDKLATLQQLAIFAAQHGMHWVGLGLPPGNNSSSGSEEDLTGSASFSARQPSRTPTKAPRLPRRPPISGPRNISAGGLRKSPCSSCGVASSR
jgi:multimeric flavodoxin WrbA